MKKTIIFISIVFFVLAIIPRTAASASDDASVYLIHGVPGKDIGLDPDLPVDMSANGKCIAKGVKFGQVVGPVKIKKGKNLIKVYEADPNNPCSGQVYDEKNITFYANEKASLLGHLTQQGDTTLSKFTNDFSPVANKKGRVVLHHTAAVSELQVEVAAITSTEHPFMRNEYFENGDKFLVELPKKWKWNMEVALSGSGSSTFYSKQLKVKPYKGMFIYLVGTRTTGTFKAIILNTKKLK